MDSSVYLRCFREGSKLRVRIVSPGYFNQSNCQCPRDIRAENREYKVPASSVTLAKGPRGTYFYRIRAPIEIQEESKAAPSAGPSKIYEDSEETECVVCMAEEKSRIFVPCGHFVCCAQCVPRLKSQCVMCRSHFTHTVGREEISM